MGRGFESCTVHTNFTHCRSLADHLAAKIPVRVKDKQLGIELTDIHVNPWRNGQKIWISRSTEETVFGGFDDS